MLLIGFV